MKNHTFFLILLLSLTSYISGQECSPDLKELYSFDIGSIFQYRTIDAASFGGNWRYYNVIEKFTVTDKWISNDTIGYIRDGIRQSYAEFEFPYEPVVKQTTWFLDTVLIIDSALHSLNACDSQLVYLGLENDFYSRIRIDTVDDIPAKRIGGIVEGHNNLYQHDPNDSLIEVIGYEYEQVSLQGIGLYRQSLVVFEGSKDIVLEGYIFDGDTTGTIWSDADFIVSTTDITEDNFFRVYPSFITDDIINLDYNTKFRHLKIFSIDGRSQDFHFIDDKRIKLNNLAAGTYIICVYFDNSILNEMIIKP